MATELPGEEKSLWIDTTASTDYPEFNERTTNQVDVAIAGGGISGLLTAWMLEKAGLTTAVIEKERIVQNTTGNTTAKLTSQHNLIYDFLINEHGLEVAKAYAKANQEAIEDIEAIIRQLGIECDFSRRDAYVYTEQADKVKTIKAEVEAAQKLGLPASFENELDLPFKIKGAIKFTQQAQFHPRKFLLAVAADYIDEGGAIFEQTEVKDIQPGSPNTLITDQGKLKAKYIVGATKYPFWKSDLFTKHSWNKLSYALGVKLKNAVSYPQGMYINSERPVRTIRAHPYKGGEILIFGGESHERTEKYDKNEHYQNLIDDAKTKFAVDKVVYRWIAGDVMPKDRMPYIGRYPNEETIYIISGFQAWGLAWAMVAAEMISDQILDRSNPLQQILSPSRLK